LVLRGLATCHDAFKFSACYKWATVGLALNDKAQAFQMLAFGSADLERRADIVYFCI